jgi:hypothetical protein
MAPMSTRFPATEALPAISPVYPFNDRGEPVVLYEGPVGGLARMAAHGVAELSCVPDLGVVWRIEGDSRVGVPGDSVTLALRRPDGDAHLTGKYQP